MKLFRYILLHDAGMAPCPDSDLITLAVCKPRIRASAKVGDWIAGFCPVSGNPALDRPLGMLAYIGRVSACLSVGEYEKKYTDRSDAIYRQQQDGSFYRKRPTYHDDADAIRKDLSAGVLVLDPDASWYFGDQPVRLIDEFLPLAAQGVGHKMNGATEAQIMALAGWLRERCPPGRYGDPRNAAMLTEEKGGCGSVGAYTQPLVISDHARRSNGAGSEQ